MSKEHSGLLINLEGGEGCGKTTLLPILVEHLRSFGLTVYSTREPGGTSIGEQIRNVLHDQKNTEMCPRAETLLYQAARAQIVEQVIKPRLNNGEIVILDRFSDSTLAYQGYGHRQDLKVIKLVIEYATGGLKPDLSILMDVDVEVGLGRKHKGEEWNRMDALPVEFHQRVKEGYQELVKEDPARWIVIDANQCLDDVSRDLIKSIEERLIPAGFVRKAQIGWRK